MRLALVLAAALGLTVVVILRRRFLAKEAIAVDARIQQNRARLKPDMAIHDDSLRVRTTAQRAEAERLRRRAAQVDSGVPLPARDLRRIG